MSPAFVWQELDKMAKNQSVQSVPS